MYATKSKHVPPLNASRGLFSQYTNRDANNRNLENLKISETESTYHYEFKIPGYIKEDFNFYINGNDQLVVTTERRGVKETSSTNESNITRHSYCYASAYFKKRFPLPKNVVRNEISVDYKNEILSFDLYKLRK